MTLGTKEEPFIKLFHTGDQEDLYRVAGSLVTFMDDTSHLKSASSSAISKKIIEEYMPDDDHFGTHLIAMGASEDYGFNKNGDFWTRKGLMHKGRDYGYETFVHYGHFFREHENDDPAKAIGIVKHAAWNHALQRVELIIWGDKRKAEEEYHLAKAGKELSFSMSARVPEDFCSICNNAAKRSKNYCVHLKKTMTQWLPKFSKFAYAINERPKFFDISRVKNPADRIAHYLEYILREDMAKAASSRDEFLYSDVLAKLSGGRVLELQTHGCSHWKRQGILEKLAATEQFIDNADSAKNDFRYHLLKSCAEYAFEPGQVNDTDLSVMRKMQPDVLWFHLGKKAAVLPFDAFAAYSTKQNVQAARNDPAVKYAEVHYLPTMFNDLLTSESDEQLENLFVACDSIKAAAVECEVAINPMLSHLEQHCSVNLEEVKSRVWRLSADGFRKLAHQKTFAGDVSCETKTKAKNLARAYAYYKVAACEAICDYHGQDIIDDALQILIVSQHK